MAIRNAAKALILHNGKVLLNICEAEAGGLEYTLPGGGQNQYESQEEALRRECLEETGLPVEMVRLGAVLEVIYTGEKQREEYPDYAHIICHVFLCRLSAGDVIEPTERDRGQTGTEWVRIGDVPELPLFPLPVRQRFQEIVNSTAPIHLGTIWID